MKKERVGRRVSVPQAELKKDIIRAWKRLKAQPFPEVGSNRELVDIRADLANIFTFGSGCLNTFIQKGSLSPGHHMVLLNCLEALQRLDGKMTLLMSMEGHETDEIEEIRAYKEDLERLLEAILICCAGPKDMESDREIDPLS